MSDFGVACPQALGMQPLYPEPHRTGSPWHLRVLPLQQTQLQSRPTREPQRGHHPDHHSAWLPHHHAAQVSLSSGTPCFHPDLCRQDQPARFRWAQGMMIHHSLRPDQKQIHPRRQTHQPHPGCNPLSQQHQTDGLIRLWLPRRGPTPGGLGAGHCQLLHQHCPSPTGVGCHHSETQVGWEHWFQAPLDLPALEASGGLLVCCPSLSSHSGHSREVPASDTGLLQVVLEKGVRRLPAVSWVLPRYLGASVAASAAAPAVASVAAPVVVPAVEGPPGPPGPAGGLQRAWGTCPTEASHSTGASWLGL